MENNFKKVLDVCCKYIKCFPKISDNIYYVAFLIEKNKELFNENDYLDKECQKMEQKYAMIADANATM